MYHTFFIYASIAFVNMPMAPVKVEKHLLSNIHTCLAYAIDILSEIYVRRVGIVWKIGVSIFVSNPFYQMAFNAIDCSSRSYGDIFRPSPFLIS